MAGCAIVKNRQQDRGSNAGIDIFAELSEIWAISGYKL